MITRSPRVLLRQWQEADRGPFAALSADPEVMRFLMPMPSRAASDAWIDRQAASQVDHGMAFWAAELAETGAFIGAVGLLRVRYAAHFTPAVEVGWRIARAFWGQGLAPEAAGAAIGWGFGHLGLDAVVANTVPGNRNSRRVMEKLGMSRDPADDFDHPLVPEGHPLRRQVLYRLRRPALRTSPRTPAGTSR